MATPEPSIEQPETREQPTPGQAGRPFGQRLVAALKLDPTLYEEIERDEGALGQAAGVVAISAVATALGAAGVVGAGGMFSGLLSSFVTWLVWTALVWMIGVKIFEHTSDFEELLRTLGFVAAPQILYVAAIIPVPLWHALVGLVVLVMTAIAFVRAVRSALDVDTGKALLVAGCALIAHVVIAAAFGIGSRTF